MPVENEKKVYMDKWLVLFAFACTAPALAAQEAPHAKAQASTDKARTALTLSRCLVTTDADDQLRLADPRNGTYRLSGTNLRRYLGKRVQVTGFRIGGLDLGVAELWYVTHFPGTFLL